MAVKTKRCSNCGETKESAAFHRDRSRSDGLFPQCKECTNANDAARYAAHREERLAQQRAHNATPEAKVKRAAYNATPQRRALRWPSTTPHITPSRK